MAFSVCLLAICVYSVNSALTLWTEGQPLGNQYLRFKETDTWQMRTGVAFSTRGEQLVSSNSHMGCWAAACCNLCLQPVAAHADFSVATRGASGHHCLQAWKELAVGSDVPVVPPQALLKLPPERTTPQQVSLAVPSLWLSSFSTPQS